MRIDTLIMLKGTPAKQLCQYLQKNSQVPGTTVMCDIDGVLVDSKQSTINSYMQALMHYGIIRFREDVEQAVWGNTWQKAARLLAIDPWTAEVVHAYKCAMKTEIIPLWKTIQRVKMLEDVVFITSSSERTATKNLTTCGLTGTCFFGCEKTNVDWWLSAVPPHHSSRKYCILDDSPAVIHAAETARVKEFTCTEH